MFTVEIVAITLSGLSKSILCKLERLNGELKKKGMFSIRRPIKVMVLNCWGPTRRRHHGHPAPTILAKSDLTAAAPAAPWCRRRDRRHRTCPEWPLARHIGLTGLAPYPNWPAFAPPQWPSFTPPLTERKFLISARGGTVSTPNT
jgi:hypothetical protein